MAYQFPLNGGRINASIGGNSTSAGAGYALVSTGTLLLAGGNNITLSQNGQNITISGGAGGGGVAVSAAGNSVSNGTVVFSNSNGVSFGMNASTITASHNGLTAQTNQTLGMYATGGTVGQSSSTTFDARSFTVSGAGAASVGFSSSRMQISVPAASSLSVTGILSISNNGNTVSIGAPAFSGGISNIGNTAGTSGTVSNQLVFAGGNNITLSQSTAAGGNTITISGANQSHQTIGLYAVGNTTQNSSTTLDARTLSINGLGGISAGYSNGSIQMSGPATSSLSVTGIVSMSTNGSTVSLGAPAFSLGISNIGNTAGTSGTASHQVILAGGNNIVLSQSTAGTGHTITISASSQSNQTISFSAGSQSTLTATGTFDARSMFLNGLGIASVGFSNSSMFVSVPSGGGAGGAAISAAGNSISNGTAVFSNSNGVSFGMNGSTVTASHNGITAQTNQTVGLYALGNTTQNSSTTLDARTLSFNGLGAATMGYSNGSIQVSAPATSSLSAGGALSISTNGSTISFNAPAASSLSATGAVSISANGSTVSIGAPPAGTISNWEPLPIGHASISNSQMGNGTVFFHKLQPQAYINASQLMLLASITITSSSNSSHAGAISVAAGIYTATGSTLSLITQSSGSTIHQWTNTSSNSLNSLSGIRGLTIPLNVNMSAGNYWIGLWSRTSSTNANWFAASNIIFTQANSGYAGLLGAATAASGGIQEAVGYYSASQTALLGSAAMSQITQSNLRSNAVPYIAFKNTVW